MTHNDSINPAIKAIDDRVELLEKELEDLRVAKKVLEGLSGNSAQVARTSGSPTRVITGTSAGSAPLPVGSVSFGPRLTESIKEKGTNKDLFISILRDSPHPWLSANEIQEQVSILKNSAVPMSTVSPTLSDMKRQGVILRNGFKVALAERVVSSTDGSRNKESTSEDMFEEP